MRAIAAQLVNEVAAELERASGQHGFAVRRTRATSRSLVAKVGSDDPASIEAEYAGRPWALRSMQAAKVALTEKWHGDQRAQ